jgi:predicted transglutaminase-like cysteine proteinase
MSPERWNLIYQVNTYVNGKIAPVSDQDLYGEPERWAYPTDAGDCEDYLLLKKRYLEGLGFPAETLLITVVLDEKNEGHAVLTVTTDGGDFILDNRRNDVFRWSDTNYTFLKRQSHANPVQWVALVKQPTSNSGFVSGGSSH